MRTTIIRTEDGAGIVFDQALMEQAGLKEGDAVNVELDGRMILLKPIRDEAIIAI